MAKRGKKSWDGSEWKKDLSSSFGKESNRSGCRKQNPINDFRENYGLQHQVRGDGEDVPSQGRVARSDAPYRYLNGVKRYNPFDYRPRGVGEDAQPTGFDRALAQEPVEMDDLELPPIPGANFLNRYAETHCLTQHEGRAWVYSPQALSHYYSQWKRYQKSFTLQPHALVEDELGDSVYRFFSEGSPYGYWDVKVGTLIEGAASITAPVEIFDFCSSIITITADIQPPTETATWEQIDGEPIPFLVTNGGRTVELFRTSEIGPFVFQGTIGGATPLIVITTIQTSPIDYPASFSFSPTVEINSPVTNIVKADVQLVGCDVSQQFNNILNITFNAPAQNTIYVESYELQQKLGANWNTVQTQNNPLDRNFLGLSANTQYRIKSNFNIFTRTFSSISNAVSFPSAFDVYNRTCQPCFGFNGSNATLVRFTAINRILIDSTPIFANQTSNTAITRYTAISKTDNDDEGAFFATGGFQSFERTDFGGVVIG